MTVKDLDRILAYCEVATPGPLTVTNDGKHIRAVAMGMQVGMYPGIASVYREEDAVLFANATTDLPRLARALRKIVGILASARADVTSCDPYIREIERCFDDD